MSDEIPPRVRQFLADHIRSITQLELLVLLHDQQGQPLTVAEAAARLYTAPSMTGPMLDSLRAIGVASPHPAGGYQYAPTSPELAQLVDEVVATYRQRRVSMINLVYSAPVRNLQSFADSFRLRKKDEEGED